MFEEKLKELENRYIEIEKLLGTPEVLKDREKFQSLSKEHKGLKEVVKKYREFKKIKEEIGDSKAMLKDKELRELAEKELEILSGKEAKIKAELEVLLIPKDTYDEKNIFMEIRAGTGGEEAALFAGDLLRMYLRYAEKKGWKTETVSSNPTGLGGFKEIIFAITGKEVYKRLKYESGVHRVQRDKGPGLSSL